MRIFEDIEKWRCHGYGTVVSFTMTHSRKISVCTTPPSKDFRFQTFLMVTIKIKSAPVRNIISSCILENNHGTHSHCGIRLVASDVAVEPRLVVDKKHI